MVGGATVEWRRPVKYQATLGEDQVELTADEARAVWDEWPEAQRTGIREGAFILWDMDELGRFRSPMIYRPIR